MVEILKDALDWKRMKREDMSERYRVCVSTAAGDGFLYQRRFSGVSSRSETPHRKEYGKIRRSCFDGKRSTERLALNTGTVQIVL